MLDETAVKTERINDHGIGCNCGCGSQVQAPAAAEEKAASDEAIRARNKLVRAPRNAPGPDSPPPFSDHSGSL